MMQPILLSDEQREFRNVIRRFAADKIAPHAAEAHRTEEFSWATFYALRSAEFAAASYSEDYQSPGASLVDQAIGPRSWSRWTPPAA